MPNVTNTVESPSGAAVTSIEVTTYLNHQRYRTSDKKTLLSKGPSTTVSAATWTLALEGNDAITPSGTFWSINEKVKLANGDEHSQYYEVLVPISGGPYSVHDIATAPLPVGANFALLATASNGQVLQSGVFTDAHKRWSMDASGRMEWGSGSAVRDTNLSRAASARLRTDGSLSIGGMLGVGVASPTKALDVEAAAQAAQIKSLGTQNTHALTAEQSGNDPAMDNAVAVNATSGNEYSSTAYVSGVQRQRATLKVSHTKPSVDDSAVNAIGVDLLGAGTAARGLAIIPTDATTGDGILFRQNSLDVFVVKGSGLVGIGVPIGGTPFGMVDIRMKDSATRGLFIRSFSGGGQDIVQLRDNADVTQLQVFSSGQVAWKLAPRWNDASLTQSTVGAAGGASAPPATPVEWIKIVTPGGSTRVIPAYLP
jgi:hypothetical protein